MKCVLFLTLLLSATLCAAQAPAALMQADRDFARATAEKGLEGWMSFMADNAVLLRAQPVVGKDAIRQTMAQGFSTPGLKLTWAPTSGQLFNGGDLGYTTGRYETRRQNANGDVMITHGTYLTVWRKQTDGSWKVVWDGGSQDSPPSAKP